MEDRATGAPAAGKLRRAVVDHGNSHQVNRHGDDGDDGGGWGGVRSSDIGCCPDRDAGNHRARLVEAKEPLAVTGQMGAEWKHQRFHVTRVAVTLSVARRTSNHLIGDPCTEKRDEQFVLPAGLYGRLYAHHPLASHSCCSRHSSSPARVSWRARPGSAAAAAGLSR